MGALAVFIALLCCFVVAVAAYPGLIARRIGFFKFPYSCGVKSFIESHSGSNSLSMHEGLAGFDSPRTADPCMFEIAQRVATDTKNGMGICIMQEMLELTESRLTKPTPTMFTDIQHSTHRIVHTALRSALRIKKYI